MPSRPNGRIDRWAVSLSGLCLVHCLAGSLLLAVLSSAGGLWSHQIHSIGLALAMPLAAIGLSRGVRLHRRWVVAVIGGIGLCFMAGALIATHGQAEEVAFTIVGVVLLAIAHLLNMRWSTC